MKKIFSFTKKKKYPSGTPDNGSVLSVGYELKDKDLGKVHKAALAGDLAKLKQLAKKNDINQLDKENRTALHIACATGHVEVVQFLVESKAKLNLCDNQNRSALMKAVQGQHERCVSLLLENHAEPSLVDINGNTALHLAANIPSISTAVLLLEHEAAINAQNKDGFTPLTVAVREDHIEMAEFLLKEGADVNFLDQDQRSPLMIAAGNGQIGMLRLLLRFDADITLKDTKGWSADDYAVMNGHHPCSLLIIEHGTQRKDGASLSHQSLSKKKKKTLLGSPSQDVEAGFSLGGPATDKDDFEDNSQSESLSRVSKSAADEWPSSEDDDESVLVEKKPQKVNLRKMIASKKGEASALPDRSLSGTESEPESENRIQRIPSLPKALPSSKALQHPVDPSPISFLSKASPMTSTPLPSYRKTQVSSDDLNEEPIREKAFLSPPTRDGAGQHHDTDGNTFSEEALPQTDIDDVDVDSPDEAENLGMRCPEVKNTEELVTEKEDSTEDENDDNDEEEEEEEEEEERDDEEEEDISEEDDQPEESGDSLDAASAVPETEISKDKKRDFLSELGLEKGEEEQDSWDSESHSENPSVPHEEKQNLQSLNQEEMSPIEEEIKENLFYVPSFLRGEGGYRMAELEPWRSVGRPRGSQGEVVTSNNGDNGGEHAHKDDSTQKETEKAKWEPLLSKLEGGYNQKTDLMEELGLGDVDDLEDASDWDTASTTSKRTLPGRRLASPGIEESPECPDPPVKEKEEEDISPAAPLTPRRSFNLDKKQLSSPQHVPHPTPRVRKMVLQKPESEEESDWEPDNLTSSRKTAKTDNQLQNIAELQAAVRSGSPEVSPVARDSKSNVESDEEQQKVSRETAKTAVEVQKSGASWDTGGTASEGVGTEKPETRLGCRKELSSQVGATQQEQRPAVTKSTSRAPVQLQLPLQQTYNNSKQEGQAVVETLQLELVRGARGSRAPQTNTHVNGDPLSVFDDSTLSEVSDDEGRLPTREQQKNENPEDMEMAEDFDELTQSSDTATDDIDSPTSGYRHASLLIQKLDSATLDSRSMVKLQNIFHEYERTIQKARSHHGSLKDKVSQLDIERAELKSSLEEVKDVKSALERNQLELQTEVANLKFQLKQEQENGRNATMMYNTTRDKLRRTEEQQQFEVQERQKVELTLRNLELEMRTLVNNMKQLEEDHSETQRLLAQERSARTLQENLLNSHLRKQQEIEEENKINLSKSNEALSQLTEASDRERELLQQNSTLQEQLSILRTDLERLQANGSLKERHLLEENEALKEQLEDARRDLKLNSDALTQTVFTCNNQMTTLKSELAITTTRLENERQARETLATEVESARTRLVGAVQEAERCQAAHTDTEKALLREKEEHQRLKDKFSSEAASQRESVSSLSQKLAKAESRANSMENEVHRGTLQLTEKSLLLDVLQREKDQAAARVKELETALQAERELVSRAGARQETTQERLAQAQSEGMLLRQQLEEAQNKGVAKERAVTDAQERFSDILAKLRSDCEERVQLVEERNKELAGKAADLRDQIYKLEEEKNERETSLRQLQQELADSLKKLSMSEASLEVNTRYRNDLEEEKARLLKDMDRLKGKLEESEDQYVQAERRINSLKSILDEREKELIIAAQKLQEALSTSATSDTTMKQLEDAVQRLEIENARLEAAAKQQSNKIDALQKAAQEAAMLSDRATGGGVRSHLEDLVSNLQSSKMTLEDQLSREVQKQSMLSHTAQDSQALWEEELKSRSKLGLRLAELEKEKGELSTQMEIEKKKAKKLVEQKKAIDTRLDQEMKRNADLQKEMYRLRTLLKTAKKKLRDQDTGGAEFASPMSSLRMDVGRHSQAEGAVGRMKEKVDDLQVQLDKEASRRSQLEKVNGELKDQLASLKSLNRSNDQLERSKRQLEEEVLDLRRRMEASQMEQSHVEQYRREAEDRARQEIQQKLEQVNLFLQSQAASQEALDQIKAANEANLRSQMEQKIRELEAELGRARTTQQDSLSQRDSTRTELERYRQLYSEELRLRKSLTAKLDRANSRLAEANSKLLNERSRSFITSSFANGSLGGPSLDVGSLASPGNYGATLGPLNRSLGLGLSILSPVTEGQNSRVEDYLAKMQSELDRNISKELNNATAELDVASARMSPVGSASRVELDPVSRAKQQYLEVLKKNNMI
ncbi:ankyrin repeat domain-containing protein 26 isoform X6 [Thunnus maccoyii]|uniref:ankyrin repeat domain-containing protein 26 isoform X6 n=1 Tax=Thunnus maccoyii TaxID=8240 RepID=UPI001C4D7D45|nr:ankyrin repeat domain-containing protein 26 isoform X6 [Thunnus maccoyii]